MREILELAPTAIELDRSAVVQRLGSPGLSEPGSQLKEALAQAEDLFITTAVPRCVVESTDWETFTEIYRGNGDNDRDTPLEIVLERADSLALFAVTLGPTISDKVATLFSEHDYLIATLLDTMASMAAEQMVEHLEVRFATQVKFRDNVATQPAVLAYSPGYCGWNVSGQTALLSVLKPEQIGVDLGSGCMMIPLKSVSGVLVSGVPEAHEFDMIFSCCSVCTTLECRSRIERVVSPVHTTTEVAWTCSNK